MRTALIVLVVSAVAASGLAQNNRSFVATFGNDANSCTPGNECRSFVRAMEVTAPGGDIIALSSGGYGPFTVSQAVSVAAAPGVIAAITANGTTGVTISASSGDSVTLRGLSITEINFGMILGGILANSYRSLTIQNCSVTGGGFGIRVAGDANSTALLADDLVQAIAGDGIDVFSRAALNRCTIQRSSYGLLVRNGINGIVTDGIASAVDLVSVGNSAGAAVFSNGGTTKSVLNLDRALISGNAYGVEAIDSTLVTVRVTNSMVTDNFSAGFYQSNAANFYSMGNNMVEGNNGNDVQGTVTPLSGH